MRGLRTYSLILSEAYVISLGLYVTYLMRDWLALIPAAISLAIPMIRWVKGLIPASFLASGIVYASLIMSNSAYFIPLALSLPFLMVRDESVRKASPGFAGPTLIEVFKYVAGASVLSIVDFRVLPPLAYLAAASLTYSLISYVKLSSGRAELIEEPKKVYLGGEGTALISASVPEWSYLIIQSGNYRKVYLGGAGLVLKAELSAGHVGRRSAEVTAWLIDSLGFSGRVIGRFIINYAVIPTAYKVLEAVGKELVSRADLKEMIAEVEVMMAELGGAGPPSLIASGEGGRIASLIREYLRGINAYATGGGVAFAERFAEVLERVSKGLGGESLSKARVGEYAGVRYFTSGDPVKHIHWKKSLSKLELVVKEFSSAGPAEVEATKSSAMEPLIIADLYAPNSTELDRVVFELMNTYLSLFRRSPIIKSSLALVVGDLLLVVRGRVMDILYRLYEALQKTPPETLFEFRAPEEPGYEVAESLIKSLRKPDLATKVILINKSFTDKLIQSLIKAGITPPKPYTAIHSNPLSFRYGIIKELLKDSGYRYFPPGTVPAVTEAQLRIKGT